MTSRDKHQDDEYQFPEDGFAEDMSVETSFAEETQEPAQPFVEKPSRPPSGLITLWESHKRMIIIVGIVAVVATVFGIMRATHKPAEVQSPASVSAPVVNAPPTAVSPAVDPQVLDQLTDLKQDAINNTVAIRQLQSQVAQLNNSLNQSRAAQQQLTQGLTVLVDQVQKLTNQVKDLSKPKTVKSAPVAKRAPIITYQLRAVVPGRAWIVGSDGQSHSVTIGDSLEQYGNIQSIDADAGVVITSRGKTIKF